MGTGDYRDTTSYKTEAMEDLKEDVLTIKNEFSNLKAELSANIVEIHTYWNTEDVDSEKVYDTMKSTHDEFDKNILAVAEEIMTGYVEAIQNQIEKYSTAGTQTLGQINSH